MIAFLRRRRNAWIVSAVLFGLGLWISAALLISVIQEISGLDKTMVRMLAPGERVLTLAEAGPHVVYFEHTSEMDGKIYLASSDAIAGLELDIRNAETGEEVPVWIAKTKGTYSIGSREGSSLMGFVAPAPGPYRFVAKVPPRDGAGPFVLAVGPGMMKNIVVVIAKIFGMVFILIAAIAIPTVLIVASTTTKLKPPAKSQATG